LPIEESLQKVEGWIIEAKITDIMIPVKLLDGNKNIKY